MDCNPVVSVAVYICCCLGIMLLANAVVPFVSR
jgi:hypothetical protein